MGSSVGVEIENVQAVFEEQRHTADAAIAEAEADRDLDEAFLRSFGLTLARAGSSGINGDKRDGGRVHGGGCNNDGSRSGFDTTRITSRPLQLLNPGATAAGYADVLQRTDDGRKADLKRKHVEAAKKDTQQELHGDYEARRREAAASLSATEYECWVIREEIETYRRQEEQLRAEIFNGDPLLPLV